VQIMEGGRNNKDVVCICISNLLYLIGRQPLVIESTINTEERFFTIKKYKKKKKIVIGPDLLNFRIKFERPSKILFFEKYVSKQTRRYLKTCPNQEARSNQKKKATQGVGRVSIRN
jgi:hypothetical protein